MFNWFAELTGLISELRELRLVHTRIAEALERLSPVLPLVSGEGGAAGMGAGAPGEGLREGEGFYMAESPAEYQERIDSEAAFAASMGVAPWSPELQKTIMEIRAEMMRPRRVQDEETGEWSDTQALSKEEADDAIRKGFLVAKAEANRRTGE